MCRYGITFYIFVLIFTLEYCVGEILIMHNKDYCKVSYKKESKKHKIIDASLNMHNNNWLVENNRFRISYAFCGNSQNCMEGTLACLQHPKISGVKTLATQFQFNNMTFSSTGDLCSHHKNYTLSVELTSTGQEKHDPVLNVSPDGCDFHVKMPHPEHIPACSVDIGGYLVDLSNLTHIYNVSARDRNFSIALCKPNPLCSNEDVNACEFMDGKESPISLHSQLKLYYNNNDLYFNGHAFKEGTTRIGKRVEIFLKCNLKETAVISTDMVFKERQKQGARYTFELKSPYACIKKDVPCVIIDKEFMYNLSGLYTEHESPWSSRSKDGREFFLQICGPAEVMNVKCTNRFAEVCENTSKISLGISLRHLAFEDDVLTATIDSGDFCEQNKSLENYSTIIKFSCDAVESGPQFVRNDTCKTYFHWKTPQACPQLVSNECQNKIKKTPQCVFQVGQDTFNFTSMIGLQKSVPYKGAEILFTICGSIKTPETPCMSDMSVILRRTNEPNIRNRLTSLGKFNSYTVEDDALTMQHTTGALCNNTIDYTTTIRYKCSVIEKEPILLNELECHYNILWETRLGCPTCIVIDTSNPHRVDLRAFSQPSVHLLLPQINLTVDICKTEYKYCSTNYREGCEVLTFKDTKIHTKANGIGIEKIISHDCSQTRNTINRVYFNLICDRVITYDRVRSQHQENCTLFIEYATNIVCSKILLDNFLQDISKKQKPLNCTTLSPYTKKPFTVNNTVLAQFQIVDYCPQIVFNDTLKIVHLVYRSPTACPTNPNTNVTYEIFYQCTTEAMNLTENICVQHFAWMSEKNCQYFSEKSSLNTGLLIFGVILSFLAVVAVMVSLYRRKYYSGYRNLLWPFYFKNGQV